MLGQDTDYKRSLRYVMNANVTSKKFGTRELLPTQPTFDGQI